MDDPRDEALEALECATGEYTVRKITGDQLCDRIIRHVDRVKIALPYYLQARPVDAPRRRRVVQVAVDPDEGCVPHAVAVCDDGSMWLLDHRSIDPSWRRLPDVPQDEEEGER